MIIPPELAKTGSEILTGPLRDVFAKLTGPFAEQIGLIFGDAAKAYRIGRAVSLLEKVQRRFSKAGLDPKAVDPRILIPVLEWSSLESNEALHDQWANLLARAATSPNEVLPSFPDTLRQLTAQDAFFLDEIYKTVWRVDDTPGRSNLGTLEELREYVRLADLKRPDGYPPKEVVDDETFELIVENVTRLGILERVPEILGEEDVFRSLWSSGDTYHLTRYGWRFLITCHAESPSS